MKDWLIPKIQGFLFHPTETFRESRDDETGPVIVYYAVLLVFMAGLFSVLELGLLLVSYSLSPATWSEISLAEVIVAPVTAFFGLLIFISVVLFFVSLWTHVWVYLAGGKKGYCRTLHAVLYSMTPALLLGWVPLIGTFASFLSLILLFLGIRELQDLSDGRTAVVIVVSVIVPVIIIIVLFILMLMYLVTPGVLYNAPGQY